MHSSGSMISIRPNSWMQSTGQTSTHERSLMSMHGSAMMYVTTASLPSGSGNAVSDRDQLVDELADAFDEGGFDHDLVEAGGVRAAEARGVGVVRVADDGDVGIRVRDLLRLDPRDVGDDEFRRVGAV